MAEGGGRCRAAEEAVMTANKDVKRLIRERQVKTGEAYSTAHMHVMSERAALVAPASATTKCEAIVLATAGRSAVVRVAGEEGDVVFRVDRELTIVPGHVATLTIDKRWSHNGRPWASGRVDDARVDVPRLGLVPLRLHGGELEDVAQTTEPVRGRSAHARMWKKNVAEPRPSFEFEAIAWGALPGEDPDDNPTCRASELRAEGRNFEAEQLLMKTLAKDVRVLDAHAGLGNAEFGERPRQALLHYEVGVRIGELSLPPGFDGLLTWANLYNRAFLRCLHGYGLSLWRLGDFAAAQQAFERMLRFNPNDNQGVRFCWADVLARRSWEQMQEREERVRAEGLQRLH